MGVLAEGPLGVVVGERVLGDVNAARELGGNAVDVPAHGRDVKFDVALVRLRFDDTVLW